MQMAVIYHCGEGTDNIGLKAKIHGQVRVVPLTHYPHADKVCFLRLDLFLRVFPAVSTKLRGGHFVTRFTHFFLNIELDRQAVAVPTGHVRRIKSRQCFRFCNDVFENFVNRMTHMQFAIGIGGAIVEDECRFALPHLTHLTIEVHGLPRLQALRLALRKIGLHRKICLGQIQRTLVITHTLSVVPQPGAGVGLIRRDPRFQGIQ